MKPLPPKRGCLARLTRTLMLTTAALCALTLLAAIAQQSPTERAQPAAAQPTVTAAASPTPLPATLTPTPTRDPRAVLNERYAAALAALPNVQRVEIAAITPAQPRTIIHAELFVDPTADYRALADAAFREALTIAATAFVDFALLMFAPDRCESWAFDTRRDEWRVTPITCP